MYSYFLPISNLQNFIMFFQNFSWFPGFSRLTVKGGSDFAVLSKFVFCVYFDVAIVFMTAVGETVVVIVTTNLVLLPINNCAGVNPHSRGVFLDS